MSLLKILQFLVPGAQGHLRIFFAAVCVTYCLGTLGRCSCFGRAFFLRRRRSFYLRTHTKFYRSRFPCPWREKVTAPTSMSKTIKRFVGRSVDRWVGWADLCGWVGGWVVGGGGWVTPPRHPHTHLRTHAPTHPLPRGWMPPGAPNPRNMVLASQKHFLKKGSKASPSRFRRP